MKHYRYLSMALAALGAMALLIPLAAGPQGGQQEILLQKAIQKETVDGDLNAAISMYRQILANPGENRAVAAKALLQIGRCYEKLGSLEAKLNGNRKGSALRLAMDIGGYSYLVSIPKPETEGLENQMETWGIIFNAEKLKDNFLQPALLRYASSEDISWVVRNRDGGGVLASSRLPSGQVSVRTDRELPNFKMPPED